jgi:hypothetical protein
MQVFFLLAEFMPSLLHLVDCCNFEYVVKSRARLPASVMDYSQKLFAL